jgi:hypothetical protein
VSARAERTDAQRGARAGMAARAQPGAGEPEWRSASGVRERRARVARERAAVAGAAAAWLGSGALAREQASSGPSSGRRPWLGRWASGSGQAPSGLTDPGAERGWPVARWFRRKRNGAREPSTGAELTASGEQTALARGRWASRS